ncbi:ribosome small subunit-dependent GTPase A [Azohydromonas sediminis]|uniref:ribosome small subunit-dependent GTPase A n=1 Tax=Azohydromonas sediminis TaxID=2259674 RepID=UPI000E64E4B2|nr:ribosome small subunit-dependent GTPase A [Azohydromonas sediminis]
MGAPAELDIARVVAGHGRHVVLETPEGRRLIGHPRGKKSECVVGDLVRWQASGDEGVVEAIEPRRNLLFRQDEWRTKSFAANVDRLLVLVAGEPMFSESQLARALVAAEDADVPATVLLNKTDLPAADAARERLAPYARMGVPVLEVALKARPDEARARLAPLLADGATLLLGPSGSGKSTLVNLLVPSAQAQVGEISRALHSGRHTTTATTWYWLDEAKRAALIDSPGFQEFGLRHIDAQRLPALMPDLRAHVHACRFYNCTHREEPGCGVRAAVERGEIAASRYRIYLEILDELTRPRW